MGQQRFSRCIRCGNTYTEEVKSGYGHLYCEPCRVIVSRERAKSRQAAYRRRKVGKR